MLSIFCASLVYDISCPFSEMAVSATTLRFALWITVVAHEITFSVIGFSPVLYTGIDIT
jgi:hypothetical protein